MDTFKEFITDKVTISKFPTMQELQNGAFEGCKFRINVSDLYRPEIDNFFRKMGAENFWFPLGEAFGLSLESLYGALRIMWQAETQKQPLLLHCHDGNNRSVMVADSYYFLRTQRHREHGQSDMDYARNRKNQLILNVNDGQLPGIYKMEEFLQYCRESFEVNFSEKDRPLDWIKHQMHMTGSGFNMSELMSVSIKKETGNNTISKNFKVNKPEPQHQRINDTGDTTISSSQPLENYKLIEKTPPKINLRTCFRCGGELAASQKRFCSAMCRTLSSQEMGVADIYPENMLYDYSDYDPEDDN